MGNRSKSWRICRKVGVLSVVLAWGTSLLQLGGAGEQPRSGLRVSAASDTTKQWIWYSTEGVGCTTIVRLVHNRPGPPFPEVCKPPYWSEVARAPTAEERARRGRVAEVASGWPFRSAVCEHATVSHSLSTGNREWSTRWGIQVSGDPTRGGEPRPPRSIPLRPIWLGLLGNAAVWGCGLGFAYWGVARWKRVRRRRRELCVECGYPVAEMGRCPECGEEVAKSEI
mgnify:CR=1 FL=1